PLPRNRWINLAAEFNVDHISFFVDGIINEQIFLPQNITLGTHPAGKTYIGKGHLFGQEYTTHGLIDDVKIWDGLRIQETHIMNLCLKLKGTELTLLHYWTMDAVEPDNTVTNLAGGPSWRVRGNPSQLRSGAPLGDEVEFRTHGAGDQVITTRIEDQTLLMTFPSSLFPVFYRNNTVFEDEEDQSCSEDFYWGIFYPYIVWDTLETYTIRSTQTQAVYTRSHGGQLWSTTPIQLQENQHQPFAGRQEFRPAVEPPELLSEDTVADCDQVVLTLQDPEISVTWNNGEIGPTLMADQPGWYVATAQSQCQNQDSTYIDILPPTELNLVGSLNQDCLFPQYELRSQATGDQLQYEWSNGELGPDILTHEPGTYRVLVSGTCGEVADEISVTFPDEFSDPVPTAFSPNGDGTNDTFQLPDYLQGVGLRVFNRWGESIHHDPNYQNLWDGHGAPDGIYYFELDDQCSGKKETSTLSIIR
ncbi:MAG: gliding motility-associated C-terminal domain-containing protein, partial [Bacteroidota bacterium]